MVSQPYRDWAQHAMQSGSLPNWRSCAIEGSFKGSVRNGIWQPHNRQADNIYPWIYPLDGLVMAELLPWPYAVDDAGEAFPAGLVGLCCKPLNSDYTETAYEKPSSEIRGLIPLPSVLPSGYTARHDQDHYEPVNGPVFYYDTDWYGDAFLTGPPDGIFSLVTWGGITSAAAVHTYPYDWYPMAWDDKTFVFSAVGISAPPGAQVNTPFYFGDSDGKSPGWRQITITATFPTTLTSGTVMHIQSSDDGLSWSTVATTTFTGTASYQFGPVLSPLGTRKLWRVQVIGYLGCNVRVHPRVDIPLWFSVTGRDDAGNPLCHTGGVVAGAVPGY